MSPRPSPCDGFTGNLPAYLDRELAAHEQGPLEAHLDGCSRCQERLRELETVSDALRGWDAQSLPAQGAPPRLLHAVLSRIERDGGRRVREVRALRLRAFALAASVLVALCGAGLLGWREQGRRLAVEPALPSWRAADPGAGLPPSQAFAPLSVPRLDDGLLRHAPWAGTVERPAAPPLIAEEEREALTLAALPAQIELAREQRVQALYGVRASFITDASTGRRMLLTPDAALWLSDPEGRLADMRRQLAEPRTEAPPAGPRDLGLTLSALLAPLLRGDEGGTLWAGRQGVYAYGARGTERHLLEVYALAPREGALAASSASTLDPLAAEADGRLRLAEPDGDAGSVVALVEHTSLPVLLAAGHLLTGGTTDRVVAESVWLPASPGRSAWQVPCVPVRVGPRRPEGGLRLTPFMAGPGLRAVLASGAGARVRGSNAAQAERVLAHVRNLLGYPAGGSASAEWSLLDLYDPARELSALAHPALAAAVATAPRGVVVTDAAGRWLGVEHVALEGAPGQLLLRRLIHGYQVEALRRGLKGATAEGPRFDEELRRLAGSGVALSEPPVAPGMAVPGVLRAVLAEDEGDAAAELLRVDGLRVLVSVLARR